MMDITFSIFYSQTVKDLCFTQRSECQNVEDLSLAAGKERTAMRTCKQAYFAGNRTYFIQLTSADGIRRRRECPDCGRRFTTYEKYEETPLMVSKKDGRRELFDAKKLLSGLIKAFEKRPISYEKIQEIAEHIERELRMRGEAEIRSEVIGEAVMNHLEKTDQIAYVRFASVYRQFADVNNFMQELQRIMKNNESIDLSDKE